jgi:hypothetical protein
MVSVAFLSLEDLYGSIEIIVFLTPIAVVCRGVKAMSPC